MLGLFEFSSTKSSPLHHTYSAGAGLILGLFEFSSTKIVSVTSQVLGLFLSSTKTIGALMQPTRECERADSCRSTHALLPAEAAAPHV